MTTWDDYFDIPISDEIKAGLKEVSGDRYDRAKRKLLELVGGGVAHSDSYKKVDGISLYKKGDRFTGVRGDVSYTADSEDEAIFFVKAQRSAQAETVLRDKAEKRVRRWMLGEEKIPDIKISRKEAHESGACALGTKMWFEKTGLDYDKSYSLKTVVENVKKAPRIEGLGVLTYVAYMNG